MFYMNSRIAGISLKLNGNYVTIIIYPIINIRIRNSVYHFPSTPHRLVIGSGQLDIVFIYPDDIIVVPIYKRTSAFYLNGRTVGMIGNPIAGLKTMRHFSVGVLTEVDIFVIVSVQYISLLITIPFPYHIHGRAAEFGSFRGIVGHGIAVAEAAETGNRIAGPIDI